MVKEEEGGRGRGGFVARAKIKALDYVTPIVVSFGVSYRYNNIFDLLVNVLLGLWISSLYQPLRLLNNNQGKEIIFRVKTPSDYVIIMLLVTNFDNVFFFFRNTLELPGPPSPRKKQQYLRASLNANVVGPRFC